MKRVSLGLYVMAAITIGGATTYLLAASHLGSLIRLEPAAALAPPSGGDMNARDFVASPERGQ